MPYHDHKIETILASTLTLLLKKQKVAILECIQGKYGIFFLYQNIFGSYVFIELCGYQNPVNCLVTGRLLLGHLLLFLSEELIEILFDSKSKRQANP